MSAGLPPSGVADTDPNKTAGHRRADFQMRLFLAARETRYGRELKKVRDLEQKLADAREHLRALAADPKHQRGVLLDHAWVLGAVYFKWDRAIALAKEAGFETPTLEALTD